MFTYVGIWDKTMLLLHAVIPCLCLHAATVTMLSSTSIPTSFNFFF